MTLDDSIQGFRLRVLREALDRFLIFYNTQRPHRGYRLRGRTPATVFRGAIAA